jgi:hypothetical protein
MTTAAVEYERKLLDRVARWPHQPPWHELSADVLQEISAREGIDFATALLYSRIRCSPEHGPFIRWVDSLMQSPNIPCCLGTTLVVVPGACYAEYPQTGADGRRLLDNAASWGCRAERLPVASFGSLAANARTICTWLDDRPEEPVLLISLSKGAADLKTALTRPEAPRAFRNVRAWVNLSGITHGTPLVSWFLNHPFRSLMIRLLCWHRGYQVSVLQELDRRRGGPLDQELVLPLPFPVIHVVGFPLNYHLTRRARRGHRRLMPLGANDGGGILLGDLSRLPGLIYPVWGADHYLQPNWDICPLIGRIVQAARDGCGAMVPKRLCEEQNV